MARSKSDHRNYSEISTPIDRAWVSHIHFGAVKLALSYHISKGQPSTCCSFPTATWRSKIQHYSNALNMTRKIITSVHVPKVVTREQTISLLPSTWMTNYEKFHENTKSV
ncbi:hypothetical protein EPI10_002703 [Gossypium australe]|uniref:Uncharacterized protein n=1 Tax=Gossypium australe TaxID=47621 RepID=A0A5B6VF74_9ROSI|nr:hypothetical protein EPI10_002703 [Gossypium australe]